MHGRHLQHKGLLPLLTAPSRCWYHKAQASTSDWTAFCAYIALGCCTAPRTLFMQPRRENWSVGLHFLVQAQSLVQDQSHAWNTDNISHGTILAGPGITSSLTSYGSLDDITQHKYLKFVPCAIIRWQDIPIEKSMVTYTGNLNICNYALELYQCTLEKQCNLKVFCGYFLILIVLKTLSHMMFQIV